MANEPMDASNVEVDAAFLEFDSAKADAVDTPGTPPVDARTTMWRAVKLYAWLATLIVAVWGLGIFTAYVYRQPSPMPVTPLEQTVGELKYGMSRHDVGEVMRKYAKTKYQPSTNLVYEFYGLGATPWLIRGDTKELVPTVFGWVGNDKRYDVVRGRWYGDWDSHDDGRWIAELWLMFYDNKLTDFAYDYWRETEMTRLFKRDIPSNRMTK